MDTVKPLPSSANPSPIPPGLTTPIDTSDTPRQDTVEGLKPPEPSIPPLQHEDSFISPFTTPKLSMVDTKRPSSTPSSGRITPEVPIQPTPRIATPQATPKTPLVTGDDDDDDDDDIDYRIHHDTLRAARWGSRWAGGYKSRTPPPLASVKPSTVTTTTLLMETQQHIQHQPHLNLTVSGPIIPMERSRE
ncbi:hypothetical protein BC829DRAFT_239528 [Chytridium lagenaria]|nr:hypothetical protein BC829DRAFT_239528 [Chytridium lagenaria]